MQQLSSAGAAFVRGLEGFVDHFYLDAATPPVGTIGEGFTMRSGAFRFWWAQHKAGTAFGPGATMTPGEADEALVFLFAREYGRAVSEFLGREVPQNVFDGMGSAVYNLGTGALQWHWAQAIRAGDIAGGAALLRKTGTTAGGRVLAGLVHRRAQEAELIEHGNYSLHAMQASAMSDGILERGERGPEVRKLIGELAQLGFYNGSMDDVFGHGTQVAVLAFQRAHGLRPDGIAGPNMLAAIQKAA